MNKYILIILVAAYSPMFAQQSGKLDFVITKHDFGNINETAGKVFKIFDFYNTGNKTIKIKNIITSCGCTTADYTHTEVTPGNKGYIRLGFDPKGRQGAFDKQVTIETDGEPINYVLTLKGNVLPARNLFAEVYKYKYGSLAVNDNTILFNKIPHNGSDSTTLYLYNISNKRIDILNIETPSNIIIAEKKFSIPPGYEKYLTIKYYPFSPVEYGQIKQEIKMYTSDDTLAVKRFFIRANVVENFGKLDAKALKIAPKAVFSTREYNFGDVKYFDSPTGIITLKNAGKQELIIRKITRSCTCLNIEPESYQIAPGKTINIKINMGLANMAGTDTKNMKFLLNDPQNTEVQVDLKINVIP